MDLGFTERGAIGHFDFQHPDGRDRWTRNTRNNEIHQNWALPATFGKTFPLEDSTMIPDLVKGITATNWDHETMPLTTTQLFRFMHDISKVSSQKFGAGHD